VSPGLGHRSLPCPRIVGARMYVRDMAVVDGVAALAGIPPGPQLAAALARIDPANVSNNHLLELLTAQSRQASHEAARLLGVIAEVGRAKPTFDDGAVDRLDRPVPHAPDEVRAALAWSRRAADRECDLAEQLVHGLPQVYAAFLAGHIDRVRRRSSPTISPGSRKPRSRPSATLCYRWPVGSPLGNSSSGCAAWWLRSIPGTTSAATARRCATGRCAPG